MSLMMRHPEAMEKYRKVATAIYEGSLPEIRKLYERERKPGDLTTYEEYAAEPDGSAPNAGRAIVRTIQTLIDNVTVGSRINGMRWAVIASKLPKFELLTSDRPLLITNGLDTPTSVIIMPISPSRIFVASNNAQTEAEVGAVFQSSRGVAQVNERVACQSRKYVWGRDDSQLDFVSKRLGRAYAADPLEALTVEGMIAAALKGGNRTS
jgi:hypothetical protein